MEKLDPLFTLRDVGVTMNGHCLLDSINLDLISSETTLIMGRSGAGKTTLLRTLNRLNECFPGCRTSGEIQLHLPGRTVRPYRNEIALPELRRLVGMVFQHPNVLPMSIKNNIIMPLITVHGLPHDLAADRARTALKEVHLWKEVRERLGADARILSGGQQQRLCLARALAMQPQALLLDEPTSSLDSIAARGIEELLAELRGRYTLIVVSHELELGARLADHLVVLRKGRVHNSLSGAEVKNRLCLDGLESLL